MPPAELLELLGDEYAREVLQTISDEPLSGQEIADAAEVSNATAYRRLESLERAGLVEGETVIDADGHHYKRYRTVLESASLRIGSEGLSVRVRTDGDNRSGDGPIPVPR